MSVCCTTSPPWIFKATSKPAFKTENSSILIFLRTILSTFFILLLDFRVIVRNQRLIKHSQLSHDVLYILTMFHHPLFLVWSHHLFFHKVPLFNLTCVFNIAVFLCAFCFVLFCWLLHKLHKLFLYLTARLPLDFVLFKHCENISLGKREWQGLNATI